MIYMMMIDVHYLCITVHYEWFLLYVRHSSFICLHLSSTFFFIFNFLYPCDHLITQYSGVFCFPLLLYDIMFDMNTLINVWYKQLLGLFHLCCVELLNAHFHFCLLLS